MKYAAIVLATLMLTACGTVGGAVSGAGDDLRTAGNWIRKQGN